MTAKLFHDKSPRKYVAGLQLEPANLDLQSDSLLTVLGGPPTPIICFSQIDINELNLHSM